MYILVPLRSHIYREMFLKPSESHAGRSPCHTGQDYFVASPQYSRLVHGETLEK